MKKGIVFAVVVAAFLFSALIATPAPAFTDILSLIGGISDLAKLSDGAGKVFDRGEADRIDNVKKRLCETAGEDLAKNGKHAEKIELIGVFEMAEKNQIAYFDVTLEGYKGVYFWALKPGKSLHYRTPKDMKILQAKFYPQDEQGRKAFLRQNFKRFFGCDFN